MKYTALIVAGGSGSRMGLGYNKTRLELDGTPLIKKTVSAFLEDPDCIQLILVYHPLDLAFYQELFPHITYVLGGETRQASVANGLEQVKSEFVLIHDGARPFVSLELIERVKKGLEHSDAVIPCLPSIDAIYDGQRYIDSAKIIQTPQGFKTTSIRQVYQDTDKMYRDEGSAYLEKIGPFLSVEGDYANYKITTKAQIKEKKNI